MLQTWPCSRTDLRIGILTQILVHQIDQSSLTLQGGQHVDRGVARGRPNRRLPGGLLRRLVGRSGLFVAHRGNLALGSFDAFLDIFLDVDKEAEENHEMESSLRGERKAQIKLATYYLTHDADELARQIYDDMRDELASRLESIQDEARSIVSDALGA